MAALRDGARRTLVGGSAQFGNWPAFSDNARGASSLVSRAGRRAMYWFPGDLHKGFSARSGATSAIVKGKRIGAAHVGSRWGCAALLIRGPGSRIRCANGVHHQHRCGRARRFRPSNFGRGPPRRALAERKIDGFWANGHGGPTVGRLRQGRRIDSCLDVRRGDRAQTLPSNYTMGLASAAHRSAARSFAYKPRARRDPRYHHQTPRPALNKRGCVARLRPPRSAAKLFSARRRAELNRRSSFLAICRYYDTRDFRNFS